jgi:Ca2+-binding EF-hand superfamily protein
LWRVFDLKKTGKVDIKELQRIMGALDFHLNPKELALVRKDIDPESKGFITFENLRLVMEDKLKEVDTYEDLVE